MVGTNPLREQAQSAANINPQHWRAVSLRMNQQGVTYDLKFLRPVSWLEAAGADVGEFIHLEIHEMGLNGAAEVVVIDPCPNIEPDDGTGRNVVKGTMAHPAANILHLDITGLDEPLGVTDTHPIWSETRHNFIKAGHLEIGEQFRTLTGESATLTAIHPHRGPPETVFNLEIDGEHVFLACSPKTGPFGMRVFSPPYTADVGNGTARKAGRSKPAKRVSRERAAARTQTGQPRAPGRSTKTAKLIGSFQQTRPILPPSSGRF